MRNPTRCSKSPLPPTARLDYTVEDAITSSLEEQIGGGCRPPSPPLETPTRLCTRVKPSEKARDNAVIQKARLRRARMGNIIGGVPSAIGNSNASPGSPPFTTIFLGPQPQNNPSILADSSSALTLSTSNTVVVTPWDPATCNVSQIMPTTHVIPPTPLPGENAIGHISSSGINRAASEPSTQTSGRRTTIVNATLSAGYDELEAILITLVERMNLPMQQILDGWHKSRSRTISGINHWNQYTKYVMRHEEQER